MRGVSTWAVAVRMPTPEDAPDGRARRDRGRDRPARLLDQAAPRLPAADHPRRRRARRVARHRLQGARHLRQRAAARGGGADLRRPRGSARSSSRWPSRSGCSSSCPVGLTSLIKDQLGSAVPVLARRGHPAHGDLPRLPAAALAPARPAARVRVPRRRAQDDLLLRGRACADARERRRSFSRLHPRCGTSFLLIVMIVAIFVFAPHRAAGLVAAGPDPHPRRAADRRHLLRDHQVGGAQPQQALGAAIMWPGLQLQKLTTREPDPASSRSRSPRWRPCSRSRSPARRTPTSWSASKSSLDARHSRRLTVSRLAVPSRLTGPESGPPSVPRGLGAAPGSLRPPGRAARRRTRPGGGASP